VSSCETDLGRSGSSGKSSIRISGGMSFRVGKKFEKELGTNLKKMISLDGHVVADTEHSENISEMFERHVKTTEDCLIQWLSIALIAARWGIAWSGLLE
jgi:hypothetical protein